MVYKSKDHNHTCLSDPDMPGRRTCARRVARHRCNFGLEAQARRLDAAEPAVITTPRGTIARVRVIGQPLPFVVGTSQPKGTAPGYGSTDSTSGRGQQDRRPDAAEPAVNTTPRRTVTRVGATSRLLPLCPYVSNRRTCARKIVITDATSLEGLAPEGTRSQVPPRQRGLRPKVRDH